MDKNIQKYKTIISTWLWILAPALAIIGLIFFLLCIGSQLSNEVVSGIAYNTSNNSFIGDNTHFSIRASEDTLVTEENQSSYCLPPNSPYKKLVNKAAVNKNIKLVVTADKYFAFKAPWVCYPNVKVSELKETIK